MLIAIEALAIASSPSDKQSDSCESASCAKWLQLKSHHALHLVHSYTITQRRRVAAAKILLSIVIATINDFSWGKWKTNTQISDDNTFPCALFSLQPTSIIVRHIWTSMTSSNDGSCRSYAGAKTAKNPHCSICSTVARVCEARNCLLLISFTF
jgi:hypothetical protein